MTKDKIEVIFDEPRFYTARAFAPFNRGKSAVESSKGGRFRIPALWLNQQVREDRGYQADVSRNGNWVKDGVLYQGDKRIITPTGLCYLHADEAVQAHQNRREYTLEGCTQEEIDKAVAEGLVIKAKDLNRNGHLVIPCNDFGSNEYGLFLFGGKGAAKERSERAEKSGKWLINAPEKISEVTLYLDGQDYSKQVGTDYATQMWFWGLGYRSVLGGGRCWLWYGGLHFVVGVLGVFDSAEGAAKNSEAN